MKLKFICVGGVKKPYYRDAAEDYARRIGRYIPFELIEVKEEPSKRKTPKDRVLKKEAERILARVGPVDTVVALDERGRGMTSKALSEFVGRAMTAGGKGDLVFVVGGAWGLDRTVLDASAMRLSLSKMTLPHELARVVLAEQVYRAFSILRGEPYSH